MSKKGNNNRPGLDFAVGDKTYKVFPLGVDEVDEFVKDNLSFGSQIFNLISKEARQRLDKWLQKKATDADGNPLSLERISEDGWDIRDLRRFLAAIADMEQ